MIFSSEQCEKIEQILQKHDHLSQHVDMFIDALKKGLDVQTEFIEHFRVMNHGNFLRENLQYCYRCDTFDFIGIKQAIQLKSREIKR